MGKTPVHNNPPEKKAGSLSAGIRGTGGLGVVVSETLIRRGEFVIMLSHDPIPQKKHGNSQIGEIYPSIIIYYACST